MAHGVVGGASSVAQGGKFGAGFLSAGVAQYAGAKLNIQNKLGEGVARAVIGGASSVLGGGKFANGAITATFGFLFNHFLHRGIADDSGRTSDAELARGVSDGDLTFEEVNYWRRNGQGQPLTVDLGTINLSGIQASEFAVNPQDFNLFNPSYFGSLNDAMVYGSIKLTLLPNNTVRATLGYDKYNFDLKKPWTLNNSPRNLQTLIGRGVAGPGTPFRINIRGTAVIQP